MGDPKDWRDMEFCSCCLGKALVRLSERTPTTPCDCCDQGIPKIALFRRYTTDIDMLRECEKQGFTLDHRYNAQICYKCPLGTTMKHMRDKANSIAEKVHEANLEARDALVQLYDPFPHKPPVAVVEPGVYNPLGRQRSGAGTLPDAPVAAGGWKRRQ